MGVFQGILKTYELTTGYRHGRRTTIVGESINLSLNAGTVTCLLGANGCGKSTFLRTLSGTQPPLAGHVEIDGLRVDSLAPQELAKLISVVYTERTNAGALTVEEVVGLGRQPYTGFFGRLSVADRRIVAEAMAAVGIGQLSRRYLATLSDGERQKTMIARALAQRTPVMILDEPTSFLDAASRMEIMKLMQQLAADFGTAVLLSTHDIAAAMSIAGYLWLMRKGMPVISGSVDDVVASGGMDSLFPDRGLVFDLSARDFRFR